MGTETLAPATVIEEKHRLSGERLEFECQSISYRSDRLAVLYRLPQDTTVADLRLKAGTLSIGYFWSDRNYNVYHWLSPAGRSLGLYVNIADQTQISPERVIWRDLIIDLLITPDGRCRVLDEEELNADLPGSLLQLIDEQRKLLESASDQLRREIEAQSRHLLTTHRLIPGPKGTADDD